MKKGFCDVGHFVDDFCLDAITQLWVKLRFHKAHSQHIGIGIEAEHSLAHHLGHCFVAGHLTELGEQVREDFHPALGGHLYQDRLLIFKVAE